MHNLKLILTTIWRCLQVIFITGTISYLFLAVCNWSLNLGEWGGFSRFIIALVGVAIFLICYDIVSHTVLKIKTKYPDEK